MNVFATVLPGVRLIEPRVFRDPRGSFLETWQQERYVRAGLSASFVQDNVSVSHAGVLRGLHYQYPDSQGKLVMTLSGEVFDVAVDIRHGSPTFGQWVGERLSEDNGRQLWIPEGFAHGYAVLSETAVFAYKCTRPYNPRTDAAIRFDDPTIGIDWPVADPIVSEKDRAAAYLSSLLPENLPPFPGRPGPVASARSQT